MSFEIIEFVGISNKTVFLSIFLCLLKRNFPETLNVPVSFTNVIQKTIKITEITSNSVQLFNTSVNLRVSIHVMGIIKIGEIFNRNK